MLMANPLAVKGILKGGPGDGRELTVTINQKLVELVSPDNQASQLMVFHVYELKQQPAYGLPAIYHYVGTRRKK